MTSWTQDRVTRLKTLWLAGHSAAAVARQLGGVTRNAVIGKVHRLGLSGRAQPCAPARLRRAPAAQPARRPWPAQRLLAPGSHVAALAGSPPEAEPAGGRVPLLQLSACGCRYGIGDPRSDDFGFCGAPQVRGRYCTRHAEIVYRPPKPARAKGDRKRWDQARRALGSAPPPG